jgi:hypothetical protein
VVCVMMFAHVKMYKKQFQKLNSFYTTVSRGDTIARYNFRYRESQINTSYSACCTYWHSFWYETSILTKLDTSCKN